MTFYKWLSNIATSDTPEGDFARDVLEDTKFPKEVSTWSEVNQYLRHTIADETVIAAAKSAFTLYEKEKQHHI